VTFGARGFYEIVYLDEAVVIRLAFGFPWCLADLATFPFLANFSPCLRQRCVLVQGSCIRVEAVCFIPRLIKGIVGKI
jgi:hypothetical protein